MSCQIWLDSYLCLINNPALQTVTEEITSLFGGQVRVRVSGICIRDERILMVRHEMYGTGSSFWSPPGGGIIFGESAGHALVREFEEETGLQVQTGRLLFVNEHIQLPLNAIELFFEILDFEGEHITGADPEMSAGGQIIKEVRWMSWEEIKMLKPAQVHRIFASIESLQDLFTIKGYISAS